MGWISAMKAPCHEVFELNKAQSTMAGTVVSWIRNFIPWKWCYQNKNGSTKIKMGLSKYYKQIFSCKVILSLSPFVAEYSPLKYHIYLLGIEIVELFLEIAASHESVAVRVENIEGCMRLFEENKFPHQRPDVRILVVIFVKHSQAWNKPKSETDIFKSLPCWPWHW